MLLSVERPFVGASVLGRSGATLPHCDGLVQAVLPASDWNMCRRTIVVPQELGRSSSLPRQMPGWRYRVTNSRPWRRTRPLGSESSECNRGTAKRRKRSAVGWAAGSHSVLIVPKKLANSPQLEPVEESETSSHGTAIEKHDECLVIRQSCPRNSSG